MRVLAGRFVVSRNGIEAKKCNRRNIEVELRGIRNAMEVTPKSCRSGIDVKVKLHRSEAEVNQREIDIQSK